MIACIQRAHTIQPKSTAHEIRGDVMPQDPGAEPASTCPLCGAALDPANPAECPKCDWVVGYRRREAQRPGTRRDGIALVLSVVPGLGHIYKNHRLTGALLMAGAVLALFAVSVAATATAGFGLLLLPLYWAGVMLHVYFLEDRALPTNMQTDAARSRATGSQTSQ